MEERRSSSTIPLTLPNVRTSASVTPSARPSSTSTIHRTLTVPSSQSRPNSHNGTGTSFSSKRPTLRPIHHRFPSSVAENPFDPNPTSSASWLPPKTLSQYALDPNPLLWGLLDVSPKFVEDDDDIHNPDEQMDRQHLKWNTRTLTTGGPFLLIVIGMVGFFLIYPVVSAAIYGAMPKNSGFNLGGINATGQIMEGRFSLIDKDTPQDVYTKTSPYDGRQLQLVFSDEFNVDGRTFWPGDDPFWVAEDLWYWPTQNLEWYDPQQVVTQGGSLVITLEAATPEDNHGLSYKGGMITTWNNFCFTGGLIEARVELPGRSDVLGLWPAIWTMGNLGRAGYGATTDGMWPYSYEACDIGTLKNQTRPDGTPNASAGRFGDFAFNYDLSWLPGQRMSSCTCPNEDHPGPKMSNGKWKARSAPEVDVFEAQITENPEDNPLLGSVSQSCQFAPFNSFYSWDNVTGAVITDPNQTIINGFKGTINQQAASFITKTDHNCYQQNLQCYSVYGFEYKPGYEADNAHITWINNDQVSWKLLAKGLGPDPISQISARPIPLEPMYILLNLGISPKFSVIDFTRLAFPFQMKVDWIRIYQDSINIGCDPDGYPTNAYIQQHIDAYTNPNITSWMGAPENGGFNQPWPKNELVDQC